MGDMMKQFTADDVTAAYWRGYEAGCLDGGNTKSIPRGLSILGAIIVSLAMWCGIIVVII